jgi:hypothetical protein
MAIIFENERVVGEISLQSDAKLRVRSYDMTTNPAYGPTSMVSLRIFKPDERGRGMVPTKKGIDLRADQWPELLGQWESIGNLLRTALQSPQENGEVPF